MKAISLPCMLAFWLGVSNAFSDRVTVQYEAEAATVVNTPFGMTVPRLTIVRGHFTYDSSTPDLNPTDPMRGRFIVSGTWEFRAEFLGRVIKGSGRSTASTNLFGSPTLSFEDGATTVDSGIMTIDGADDPEVGLNFRISGTASDLPTDKLPEKFTFKPPPGGASHTFVLDDDEGRMLLQFRWFRQTLDAPEGLLLIVS